MLKQNFLRSLWLWMLFIVVGNVGAQNVARIGTTGYATLQAAIDAAAKGKTVTLMQDVAENVVVADNKSLTIDLGEFTLNGKQTANTPTVKNQGTLTLKNGKIRRSGDGSASWYVIENEGTVTMTTGLDVEGSASASLIRNNAATAKMTISAGTYTQKGNFIVVKNDLGTVTINGGTFTTGAGNNVLNNWDQMTINGGTFSGNILNGAYDKDNNVLKINAGEFDAALVRNYVGNGKTNCPIVINGGTFTNENLKFVGTNKNESDTDIQVAVYGGTFTATVPEAYKKYVAKIGEITYGNLADAIAAVPTNGTATTIKMLTDAVIEKALTVANTQNVILDLNGKTIKNVEGTALDQLITVNGKLTIDDNSADKDGVIKNSTDKKYVLSTGAADAELTLANGTVQSTTGTTSKSINASKGTFVMTGGKIISTGYGVSATTVNISGGEISAYDMAVSSGGTISGGTLTSTTKYAVYTGTSSNKQMVVSGGTFNPAAGKAAVVIYCANAKVTGGTFNVSNAKVIDFSVNTATTGVILPGSLYAEDVTDSEIYVNEELYGYYSIAATSKMNAPAGATIKLTKNVATSSLVTVPANVVAINLNGKNITTTGTTALDIYQGTTTARHNLVIEGEGTVSANNGGACNTVNVKAGVDLTIKGGTYNVGGESDNATIYIMNATSALPSTVNIEGGNFIANNAWILNIKDAVRANAKFNVTGGTFKGFNPANCISEGNPTNFVAEGYESVDNGEGTWTVRQKPVSVDVPEANEEGVVVIEKEKDAPEATEEEKAAATTAVTEVLAEISNNTTTTADDATNVETAEGVTTLAITVANVTVETTPAGEGTDATATVTKVTYEVQPKDEEGQNVDEPAQLITFRLPVPQSFKGNSVKVSHKHNEVITSTYETVQGEGANKFVALSSDKFSEWTLEDVNPSTVAVIGESQYNSLADAIAAVPTNGTATITIVKDIVAPDAMTISGGKNIVLDLNGKTVQHDGAKLFIVGNATLHVTGTGALFENAVDQYAPIIAKGSATDVADYTNIIIDENVTLKGHYSGILIATDAAGTYKNYGLNITMKGKIDLAAVQGAAANFGVGVYVNGKNTVTEGNVMNIDLTGATISGGEIGVYAAGYANWTLNNTTITGYNSAVEVRSGKMEIDGGTYTALNPTFKCTANGNGATVEGAAIAIAQHTTKKDIAVTIKGGEFNGAKSLYEANPQANDPAPQVDLTITDGTFKGAVETTDVINFISGGSFNEVIPQAYCALGFVPVTTPDADGMYTVEESDTELTVYVGDSTPRAMKILEFLETQETQPNAMAVVSFTNATEVAGMTNVIVDYPVGHSHYYECENFVLDDWYDWYSPVEEFVAVDGSYSRDINEGLTTICVPFDVVENTAFTKYIFHSSNEAGTTAYFNSVAKVNAGEAFLADIHSTNTWNYNFNNTRIYANTKEGGAIRGTYNTVVNSCLKVNGQGTGLGYFENETTFAFRAYFVLDGVDVFTGSHVQNIRIAFDEIEDATTGISAVGNDADDNVIYNIQGLRQSKQQKGLNIVNGKKVLK